MITDTPYFSRPKADEHEEIECLVEEFLESGGSIQYIPTGVFADDYTITKKKHRRQAITQ